MSNKLFVGNLSFNTTENDLQDAFAAHGTVTETNLMMDRTTQRPRGFGFVTMSTAEEAQKAIAALNGKEMDGRALTVNVAKPREERCDGRISILPPGRSADILVRGSVQGFTWLGKQVDRCCNRSLLRTGMSALRWRLR